MEYANTYVKIDLDAIRENFQNICKKAGAPVMAVVKADAYGHGAVPVARELESMCAFFGVSSVAEALELKNAGELRVDYSLGLDIVRDDDNIKQYFRVSVKIGENWSEPQSLVDGFEIGNGELAPGESLSISVKITLDTSAPDIKGKELAMVLFLRTQQVLGSGGNV